MYRDNGIEFMKLVNGNTLTMPALVKENPQSGTFWSLYYLEKHKETFLMHAVFWIYTNPQLTIKDYKFFTNDYGTMHLKSVTVNGDTSSF